MTDPENPTLIRHVYGPPNTWTLQVCIKDRLLAASMEKIPPGWGGNESAPYDEGVILFDIADPANPRRQSVWRTSANGTHRNRFDSEGLLHVAASMPGYAGCIYVVLDCTDVTAPMEVGRLHVPGQHVAAGETMGMEALSHHGPGFRQGTNVYLPYQSAGLIIADISDVTAPKIVGRLAVHPPLGSGIAAHTAVPLPGRHLLILNSEAIAEGCSEPLNYAGLVDISDSGQPFLVSVFPLPVPPRGSGYRSYCEVGGRFGPHNQHIPADYDPNLWSDSSICFLTYFNAGLRVYDVSQRDVVEEMAHIVPRDPDHRLGLKPSRLVTQVEDVLVDARGVIYFTEKNSGLYIAQWAG